MLKGRLVCVSHMEGGVGVSIQNVQKEPKGVLPIARPMEVASGVFLLGAPKGLRGAHHFVKVMVEGNVVCLTEAVFVRKVYMVVLIIVLHMVAGRGVLFQTAQRVPVVVQTIVLGMVVGNDAGLTIVERVLKEVQTFVKHMVVENVVHGEKVIVRNLLEERVGFVHHMVAWFKTKTTTRTT